MQMNAEFKGEQIGTPFVWVGALEGGGRGGGGKRGSNPKNTRDVYFFFPPSCLCIKINEFGVKGESGGLDLFHFPARRWYGVGMQVLVEISPILCSQIALGSNHAHQSKKKGG